MKIAIVTDIHIGARGDSKVFHEVQRKFFQEVFFPYLDENGITTVFDLGDTFDRRKYINYVSLQRGKEFLFDELAKRKIDFWKKHPDYFYPDGVHPNRKAHKKLAQFIDDYIDKHG